MPTHDAGHDAATVDASKDAVHTDAGEVDDARSDSHSNDAPIDSKYTHGYGVTMSRVDQVTASGQPEMLIGGIPADSSVKEINITRPEVYFGERTNEYIVVDTKEDEFDYPDGDSNKYTRYEGSAGIKMNLLNRIMFAIRERSIKLLVSSNINSDSKIVINRNIEQRVKTH